MTHQNNQDSALSDDSEQPLLYHLIELRDRLLRVVLVVGVVFIALLPFSNTLFTLLSGPLMAHMPDDSSMIAIEVASPFLIPFKLTLFLALFISIPYVLYQLWSFVAPGLYKHERRLVYPLLVSSTVLFYAGAAFAYFVVFPLIFAFFTSTAPEGVSVMTDISRYLDFVLTLFFAFGVAFEVPIFTILLVWTGVATQEGLREKRPYIIVGAFVIGMLLTPPDIISQTLLAVPVLLLFELGVFFSGWFIKQKENISSESDNASVTAYEPMSDDEMDAELDRMENDEKD
ncbi:MAG: twin-arginine translocase subunit TatC [Pseudomonadota bacterium]